MIGLIMAGGKGSRMSMPGEKLLIRYRKPVILHVADALAQTGCISSVVAVTSPHSPRTRLLLERTGIKIMQSAGSGYSADLNHALRQLDGMVLVVPGDLPLLDPDMAGRLASLHDDTREWISVLVPDGLYGSESDYAVQCGGTRCRYTGISLVDASRITSDRTVDEHHVIINDRRIGLNLNTRDDCDLVGIA